MDFISQRCIFHGRVQGVGFRATTLQIASGFQVSGYVRNLPDRSVEVVARGSETQVALFLEAIEREFERKIRDREIFEFPAESTELSGFEIRY